MDQLNLSPLELHARIQLHYEMPPRWAYTGPTMPMGYRITVQGICALTGEHEWHLADEQTVDDWEWVGPWVYPTTSRIFTQTYLTLDWAADQIYITIICDNLDGNHVIGGRMELTVGGCEQGSPWDTYPKVVPGIEGYKGNTVARWRRNISPLAPLLPMFVSSPTVHGVIGYHCVHRSPTYPDGAIFGQTPPGPYTTRMRNRPHTVFYTDQGHLRRQSAFQSAATQWNALTPQQRQDWATAAATLPNRPSGWNLWLQTVLTRRTDRITTLNARTGLTLATPTLPP